MTPPESSSTYLIQSGAPSPFGDPYQTVLVLHGDYDIANRREVTAALVRATQLDDVNVLVDLSEVTFMDASTVGAIMEGAHLLESLSRSLSVRAPSHSATFVLELCGLTRLVQAAVKAA